MRRALVTGGRGFIGSRLVKRLVERGDSVRVISLREQSLTEENPKVEYVYGSVLDPEVVNKSLEAVDVVFHLAGRLGTHETISDVIGTTTDNIIGTLNILEAARTRGVEKVVFPTKPNVWLNPYSITKQAAEDYCKLYTKEFGMKTYLPRWFNAYGPGQSLHVQKAVPTFIVKALKGEPLSIYGDGRQTGDFIHVDDLVDATIAIEQGKGTVAKPIDVGTGVGTEVIELARMIVRITGSKSKLKFEPMRRGEDPGTKLAADLKELNRLGFKCKHSFEEGMTETVEFYREKVKDGTL